jgi:hypothetical protein
MILWRRCGHELRPRLYPHNSDVSGRIDGLCERRQLSPTGWTIPNCAASLPDGIEPLDGGFKVDDCCRSVVVEMKPRRQRGGQTF